MNIGEIIDFTSLDADIQELIRESVAARENSYSPYSNFKVGAAVRCADGSISRGCNVENVSFPAGVCAEVAAVVRAVSDGKQKFTVLAVAGDQETTTFTTPCGVCRQFLSEFGNIPIYLSRTDMTKVLRTEVNELLPLAYGHNERQ
ncbi:cytidine deaminase [Solenopsis invicta]|uniref:cytidine deaminase n=1 Tax=Solenopsis invicta TaxID=13686 RepID=UPI0005960E53|nr:cytidine deaminase [Solenopsis invicta]